MLWKLSSLVACSQLLTVATAVWPQPQRYEHGSTVLWLSPTDVTHRIEQDDLLEASIWAGWIRTQQFLGFGTSSLLGLEPF